MNVLPTPGWLFNRISLLSLFTSSLLMDSPRPVPPNRLLVAAIAGLGFALYLTYIEAYELMTWCILCLISLALISLISILAIILKLSVAKA